MDYSDSSLSESEINSKSQNLSQFVLELSLSVLVVCQNNHLDKVVAHDVFIGKMNELDALDVAQNALGFDKPRAPARRQVYLRDVARNDRLRPESYARQKHLHLLGRSVLRFVENDEGIRQASGRA